MKKLILVLLLIGCQGKTSKLSDFDIIHIEGGTFDIQLDIIITQDTQRALKYVKEHNDTSAKIDDFDARGVTFVINEGRPPIIWIPQMDGSPEDISILNHELLHANISILSWAGLSLSDSTEEVYTYNYQFLTKNFYKQYRTR